MSLTIIRVTIRGVRLPRDTEDIDGVKYSRKRSSRPAIHMTLAKERRRHSVVYPRRTDSDLRISVVSSKDVALVQVELDGDQVERLVARVGKADSIAEAVQAMKPLLDYIGRSFSTT